MKRPAIPSNENERLEALRSYSILDTLPEEDFDEITRLASEICKTPVSLITLIDTDRQWFKSNRGLTGNGTTRDLAFCAHAINEPEKILQVVDARKDDRFSDHPSVIGDPHVIFYAGVPLVDGDGYALGTLCVIDHEPRALTDSEKVSLKALSNQVVKLLELRKLNTLLAAKEQRYRELVDGVNDMLYELDADGKFTFVNKNVIKRLQLSERELIGKFYADVVHPDDRTRVITFYQHQLRSLQESSYLELRLLTPDQTEIWIGQNVKLFFENERVPKVVAVARDITQLKDAQAKITQGNLLLRTIIDNIPVNIYAKNKKLEKILANRTEYQYMGFRSEKDVLGLNDFDFLPFEIASLGKFHDEQVLNGESIVNVEAISTRADGNQNWFLVSKVPLRDERGEVVGMVGIGTDITERKHLAEQLAGSEKLYRLLAENSKDVISLHNLDGVFEFVSPSCIELYGYTPDELVGRRGIEFIYAEDAARVREIANSVREKLRLNLEVDPLAFRLATKNKGAVWVENVFKPVFDARGELTGFQSTLRDISIRKKIEESLQEAKIFAEQAAQAQSQFLSVMSHEIRTPLNGIIGLVNILMQNNPKPDQQEYLSLLRFSSGNLLSIVNDILDYNKIESGKIELEKITFNFSELAQQCCKLHSFRAQEKGVNLKVSIDQKVPQFLVGDPLRLSQIINNLLGNAIKFTSRGDVQFRATAVENRDGSSTVRVAIKDSGIGIPEEKLSSIFDAFSQANLSTSRKFGGTGLGLSIVKRLLALMGSVINVQSELNVGSEFSFVFTLPVATEIPLVDTTDLQHNGESMHVLVVDDNPVNLLVASNIINGMGHTVETVKSGREAIDRITPNSYNMIFLDIQMPDMDGYETARAIRSNEQKYYKDVPIIALSADVIADTRKKAADVGMNDFLGKPFEVTDLQKILARYRGAVEKVERKINLKTKIRDFIQGDDDQVTVLASHMVKNLDELHLAILETCETLVAAPMELALHKSKTTLGMLGDQSISQLVNDIKERSSQPGFKLDEALKQRIAETFDPITSGLK